MTIQASRKDARPLQVFVPGSPAFKTHAARMVQSMLTSAERRTRALEKAK